MKAYLDLLADVLQNGSRQSNRTGIDAISLPGAMLKFDLAEGFPAVTTKKLAWKAVVGELVGFLRGCDNAAEFRALGCNVWNQNANENKQWLANPNRKGRMIWGASTASSGVSGRAKTAASSTRSPTCSTRFARIRRIAA